jgi:hypothetical protein
VVLLTCVDHDPGGLHIAEKLAQNLHDVRLAAGCDWDPLDVIEIVRFGLTADFIDEHRLTWIDGLETASGGRLDNPKHKDHHKPYVQDYLRAFGARKCEANALIVRPEAGRGLCAETLDGYIDNASLESSPYVTETGAHERATAGGGRSCCLSSRGLTRCAASPMIVTSHHSR